MARSEVRAARELAHDTSPTTHSLLSSRRAAHEWTEHKCGDTGRTYYLNSRTGTTQWHLPRALGSDGDKGEAAQPPASVGNVDEVYETERASEFGVMCPMHVEYQEGGESEGGVK